MSRRQQRTYLFFVVVGLIVVCTNLYVAYTIRVSADVAQQPGSPAPSEAPKLNADDDSGSDDSGGAGDAPVAGKKHRFMKGKHGGKGHNPVAHHHHHGGAAEVELPPETQHARSTHRPHHHHHDDAGSDEPVTGKAPEDTPARHHHHRHGSGADDGDAVVEDKPKKVKGNNKHKNQLRDPAKMRDKRMAFAMPSNGFSDMKYDDAVKAYNDNINTDIGTRVNQSSISFIDIVEDPNAGVRLPETPIVAKSAHAATSDDPRCNPSDNRFTTESDAACKAYLADPANWESVKPMSSILSTGRTIKFRVFLRNGAAAVMKVPQNKFVLEPSSEVEAFETDRLIGFKRVPPVAWVSFPLKYLQAACGSKILSDVTARQLPLKSQRAAFYSQWFQKFVVEYKQAAAALHSDPATKEPMLFVSLQIWMNDVHNADETALRPPPNYRQMMKADKPFPSDASNWTRAGVSELSDVSLFDYIIGNTDRWFGHNSFAFGGCSLDAEVRPAPRCHNPTAPGKQILGAPTYAFIDQGSSFYKTGPPDQTLYFGSKLKPTVDDLCRFRKTSAEGILAVARLENGHKDYYAEMLARLPRGIFSVGSKYLVKAARTRVEHLAKMIEHCLERFPREDVLFF